MDSTADFSSLSAYVDSESNRPIADPAQALCTTLRQRYGDPVVAIIYYGSCYRDGSETDGIMDVFVIVDRYRAVYPSLSLAIANYLLPPNVFYLEQEHAGHTLRTKYAVITLEQFIQRTSPQCFHTFFWARFAQRCALAYTRDPTSRVRLVAALTNAITTFVTRSVPLLGPTFDAQTLWITGLSASYRTELRPEDKSRAARLVAQDRERYEAITRLLAEELPSVLQQDGDRSSLFRASLPAAHRLLTRGAWRVRPLQGKLINLLRILKAAFTFDGGVDYVLWKIEKHSGIKVEATPMLRKHPLLTCWPTVWRLYRAGAFR